MTTRRCTVLALFGITSPAALAIEGADADWVWRSADEGAGAPLTWADLEDTGGTELSMGSGSATVTLGFTVTLLGRTVSAVTITEDGLVLPGSSAGPGAPGTGRCIGDGSTTGAAIAPLWGDWDLSVSGSVWAKTWDDGVIIEWHDLRTSSSDSSGVDFGVLIRSNGEISFAYPDTSTGRTATSQGSGASIGLQDSSGSGVAIGCDESVLKSADDAIAFSPLGTRFLAGEHTILIMALR